MSSSKTTVDAIRVFGITVGFFPDWEMVSIQFSEKDPSKLGDLSAILPAGSFALDPPMAKALISELQRVISAIESGSDRPESH